VRLLGILAGLFHRGFVFERDAGGHLGAVHVPPGVPGHTPGCENRQHQQQRAERAQALGRAQGLGAISDYAGIRVDSRGRRFRIEGARLWTLLDEQGRPQGQAASFARWWWL
jgi:hypothetical protein